MIIPERLFKEPIQNEVEKIYNPKSLKQLARENIKLDDKQMNEELAKTMINPYYFTNRVLQLGFNITLESDHNNHANSMLIIKPNYPEFGIAVRYTIKIIKDLSVIYARRRNESNINYQTVFSARFDKPHENNQVKYETKFSSI